MVLGIDTCLVQWCRVSRRRLLDCLRQVGLCQVGSLAEGRLEDRIEVGYIGRGIEA